jgi:hypothetical protein
MLFMSTCEHGHESNANGYITSCTGLYISARIWPCIHVSGTIDVMTISGCPKFTDQPSKKRAVTNLPNLNVPPHPIHS